MAALLAPDGSLWAWGGGDANLKKFLGNTNAYAVPQRIASDTSWRKIAVNASELLAEKSDGTLWLWERPSRSGTNMPAVASPKQISADTDWTDIATGSGHYMALKQDGSVWTWGRNAYGQLGNGGTTENNKPSRVGSEHWRAITAGHFNSYAIHADGTFWGWGLDSAMGSGGTNDFVPRQVDADTNWVALSASAYCLLALKGDGSLWLRGQNAQWEASAFRTNRQFAFTRIGNDNDWKEIHCGEKFLYARKADGTWWVCGSNESGQLGVGAGDDFAPLNAPQQLPYKFDPWAMTVTTYGSTTLVLLRDGSLWTTGLQLGAPKRSGTIIRFKRFVNQWSQRLPGKPRFKIREDPIDPVPRKFWSLPRGIVETNRNH